MSLSKSFTAEKIATVQSWADAGDGLSEIQRKLNSEMQVKVTYMELRFLIDDLGVKLKEEIPEPEKAVDDEENEDDLDETVPTGNEAVVSISALQRPGALLSGTVTFAEGNNAEWWLDQNGQLGMSPKTPDFRPNPEQMRAFQKELQKLVQKRGF